VVVSIEEYRRLTDELPSFKEFLVAAPTQLERPCLAGIGSRR
jgi:hypothetical protein